MKFTRTELNKKYGFNSTQWTRRHDDLMNWLKEFMDINEIQDSNSRYYYEINGEMPDNIPRLPRISHVQIQTQNKIEAYEDYVIKHLPQEFEPMSKSKMSRDAIADFGRKEYNHTSYAAVSRRYVGPAMDKHGEHSLKMVWVDAKTYKALTEEQEQFLHDCFNKVHLSEQEMANAFRKYAQEQDITEEVNNFNEAINIFRLEYGFRPISVYEWKVK